MKNKIVWKEVQKGKLICVILIVFIIMASALFASAVDLLYSLNTTLDLFNEQTKTSHILQMHSGEIDSAAIDSFAANNADIEAYEIVRLLNIDAENLYINNDETSESGSVIDCALVVQNTKFDFLLDSENNVASVNEGEALVPVYYKIKYNLNTGDYIKVKAGDEIIQFKIADFSKDSEMNSSYISSKRILINEKDWNSIAKKTGSLEYVIEFRTTDMDKIDSVETAYLDEGLPANGATITYSEIKLLNSLTDVLTAALLMIIVVFLIVISILCVRFAMISSIDQDYMDIAVMRGLGIPNKYIESIFLIKYTLITLVGCIIGYIMSFWLSPLVEQNLNTYMGIADKNLFNYIIQLLACAIVGCVIVLLCRKSIKRIEKVNTVNALQDNNDISSDKVIRHPSLFGRGGFWTNFKLGIKYLFCYKKPYIILTLISVAMSFLVLLPVQITSTVKSSEFTSYMGVTSCDIRIDYQQGQVNRDKISSLFSEYNDIDDYQVFDTYLVKTENSDGESVTVNFETGDYSIFGLSCMTGNLPQNSNQIAISYLLSDDLKLKVGDAITFNIAGNEKSYTICGIYQDITNGGKSAKSIEDNLGAEANRSVVNINIAANTDKQQIKDKLEVDCSDGKVTDIDDYVRQSMGDVISQFDMITLITVIIAIMVTILSVTVFIRILIIRYKDDIAVMKALGYKNSDIRTQYRTRIIIPLILGMIIGTVLVRVAGQGLVGMFTASMGAPQIVFVVNPFVVYGFFPISILVVAIVTIYISSYMLNNIRIIQK
jgi:putative ABC transport system permease protein